MLNIPSLKTYIDLTYNFFIKKLNLPKVFIEMYELIKLKKYFINDSIYQNADICNDSI